MYGFSLFALRRNRVWRARAAFTKGALMAGFGFAVLFQVAAGSGLATPPRAGMMAAVGALAFAANALCFGLLWRYRRADVNLRSTWLCSRNDLIGNAAVLGAAALVASTGARWPDLVVGLAIAALFLRTAITVLRDSLRELGRAREAAVGSAA